jgi:Kdo2-lipid IVA lauroyltransferase/acyltransferase
LCNRKKFEHNPRVTYRIKHLVEYAALRAITAVLCLLPVTVALAFGWLLARISYCFIGKRSAEARRRMRSVFGPDIPEAQLRQWAWISWRNIFFNVIEISRAPTWNMKKVDRLVKYTETQKLIARQREHGGYTLAVCHMGNWELAGFTVRLLGLPIFVMMRGQSNPLVTAYLDRIREQTGVGAIERHSKALGSIIKRIRAGGVFTILPDIRAKTIDASVKVPFLGGEAYLNAGMGLFAKHTETPIVTALVLRRGWAQHEIIVHDPIFPDPALDRDADILRMTTLVMQRLEAAIRHDPGQYFWYNKRWVLDHQFT